LLSLKTLALATLAVLNLVSRVGKQHTGLSLLVAAMPQDPSQWNNTLSKELTFVGMLFYLETSGGESSN